MEEENVIKSFEGSFLREDKMDLAADVGDAAIDAALDSGALDSIPILGLLKGAYTLTKNIQTRRLCKKIVKFLYDSENISQQDKDCFIKEYTDVNKERGAEVLLSVLDRLDNVNKVDVLANLMEAKVKEEISIIDFVRLSQIIERLPYVDLQNLIKYEEDYTETGTDDSLLAAGVIYESIMDLQNDSKYRLNYLGQILVKFGLYENIEITQSGVRSMPGALSAHVEENTLNLNS